MVQAPCRNSPKVGTAPGIPLLTTKLYLPPARPGPVPRPRLTDRLNRGLDKKLILVSAPAGFGKTTLLSEWRMTAPASKLPFAWLSLEEGDNDPARFWAYVVAALQRIEPDVGADLLAAFRSPQPPAAEAVLPFLVNELAALPHDVALVLDDYHVITADTIHQALAFLLAHLPPQLHLVIASRAEPPLPLTLLRGRGQLTELREADLRFTLSEIAAFFNEVMGLALTAEQMGVLAERTEGWIVGLQLAALSMQGRQDVAAFVAAFSGSQRHVADYLVEQVLQRQPEAVRRFLLETSVLNRMCAPLCEAVTEQSGGQAMLERLEEANLFLIPLDDERRWYRYHHLFADVLRSRLRQTQPDIVPALHHRAAMWYETNDLLPEAVAHALAAGDYEMAARMIERSAHLMFQHGDHTTVLAWLQALPEATISTRPWLCIRYSEALSYAVQLAAADKWMAEAQGLLKSRGTGTGETRAELQELWGIVLAWRMTRIGMEGDTARIEALAQQARALFPDDVQWQYAVSAQAGEAYWLNLDLVKAEQRVTEAVAHVPSDHPRMPNFFFQLSEVQGERGRLRQAERSCLQLLNLASAIEGAPGALFAGRSHRSLGVIHYEWNHLTVAAHHFQEALATGRQQNAASLLPYAYTGLAWVYQAQGDTARAAELVQQALPFEPRLRQEVINLGSLKAWWAHLWLVQGNMDAANRWAAELDFTMDDLFFLRRDEHLVLARVFLAQGRVDDALDLLSRLWQRAKVQEWYRVPILMLQALAHQTQGDMRQAIATLQQALALAEPEGFVRTFVDEGEPLARLLRQATAHNVAPHYAGRLLAAFPPPAARPARAPQPLAEPLTRREQEVLRWLQAGLTTPEIARELVVAESTVNSHLKSLYRKLDVHNRTEAIDRAAELGLPSP